MAEAGGWIWHADNLAAMARLEPASFQLVYLDPPFFSRRVRKERSDARGFRAEYPDWTAGALEDYLWWLKLRFEASRRLLAPDGNLVVHLDWRAVHYVKVLLDGLYGQDCFRNEIVWTYRTGGAGRRGFARKHDTLLWYSRERTGFVFNLTRERVFYGKAFFGTEKDAEGRPYADVCLSDVWSIPAVLNVSSERAGYPTQKPLALLERVVSCLSDSGSKVGDFFCGSGTTALASWRLGRRWVLCDENPDAIRVTRERLDAAGAPYELLSDP